jgi:DNA-binding XRE family transcriptional regulator
MSKGNRFLKLFIIGNTKIRQKFRKIFKISHLDVTVLLPFIIFPHYLTMELLKIIGKNVKLLREARGYTQGDLAQVSGLQRGYIGDIERGSRNLTISSLSQIADALGIHPGMLLFEEAIRKSQLSQSALNK